MSALNARRNWRSFNPGKLLAAAGVSCTIAATAGLVVAGAIVRGWQSTIMGGCNQQPAAVRGGV